MAELKETTVIKIESDNPAELPHELVRLQELDARLAATPTGGHTHVHTDVTDWDEAVRDTFFAGLMSDGSVTWSYQDEADTYLATVQKHDGGFLISDFDGLGVDVSETGLVTKAELSGLLHDPATVEDSDTIDFSIVGQIISGEVRLAPDGGLSASDTGLAVTFGTGHNEAARGDHTHAGETGLHPRVTVADTDTIDATITDGDQAFTFDVRLDEDPDTSLYRRIISTSDGLAVPIGPTGVAAYEHTHEIATTTEDGFLSAADKRKLDGLTPLQQIDQVAGYSRESALLQGEYVGGRHRWGQTMQVINMTLTARAALSTTIVGIEIDGIVYDTVEIPIGTENSDVAVEAALDIENLFVQAGNYVRWVCESGVGNDQVELAPTLIDISMLMRPAVDSIPEYQINAGGGAVTPFVADAYYSTGNPSYLAVTVDTSAVSSPAPQECYQRFRYKFYNTYPLVYTIPGLARAVQYAVRLHFAEMYWDNIGDQRMNISVAGATTSTLSNYDVLSQTSGVKYKADIREFFIAPDENGQIVITLQPLSGTTGYNLAIAAIEVLEV